MLDMSYPPAGADIDTEADPFISALGKISSRTTQSEESWNSFKAWVWTCISKHAQCSPSSLGLRQRRIPKRLLEVGDTDTVKLCKVDGMGANATEYLALSHCWGSGPTITLTSKTAAMLSAGIEVSSLCRTFQDAIRITRRFWAEFAVRYIWIDSLCIMQDSPEDWREESGIMGEIYQNAFCTLAATAAADGERGLFSGRDPRAINPCAVPVQSQAGGQKLFYCVDHEDWTRNVSRGPLNGRSWVLQERLLSPRVLHFAVDQLYWECSALEASEAFPQGFPDGAREQFKSLLPFSGLPPRMEQRDMEPSLRAQGPYGIWDQVMETYAAGKLTRSTDRLVALSGIARKLQQRLLQNDTYLAGLWKNDLPLGLLWDVRDPQLLAPGPYIAPTWSWASRTTTVPCSEHKLEPKTWANATVLIEITGAGALPLTNDGDRMGQVKGGSIRLTGVLARAILSRLHQPGSPTPGLQLKVRNQAINSAILRPDDGFSLAIPLPPVVYCLPLLQGKRWRAPRYRGLLLVPSGGPQGEFRRYGTFTAETEGDEFRWSSGYPYRFGATRLCAEERQEIVIV
jgi:hypothetical protein